MKRFYKAATAQEVDGGWQVMLDSRGMKTVKGSPQIVPSEALAEALADEWARQGEEIDPKSFVFRDMADYAIDIVAPDVAAKADELTAYGDTDTLLYRADPDQPLYPRQLEVWEPIVTAFEAREGVKMTRVSGILHRPQAPEALAKLRAKLSGQSPFALAGLETMTTLAASLIIGLSSMEPETDAEALWNAASLEEDWQADLWGRDEEAEERRAKRQAGFLRAREFTRLSQP
ncbi:MAG: ATP12 family protein [Pseudomonadota bacterium]